MGYLYSAIKLGDEFNAYLDSNKQKLQEIGVLSNVNIFVGANNSGKSRFLREIAKIEEIEFKRENLDLEVLRNELKKLNAEIQKIISKQGGSFTFSAGSHRFRVESGSGAHDLDLLPYCREYFGSFYFDEKEKNIKSLLTILQALSSGAYSLQEYRGNPNIRNFQIEMLATLNGNRSFVESLKEFLFREERFSKVYIPILRSLNCFDEYTENSNFADKDMYKHRTSAKYDLHIGKVDIFTGQKLYNRIRSMLLGELKERKKIIEYQSYLKRNIFEGEEVVLIPREEKDVLYVKVGKEKERPIYDLGDGIQSIIMLTFPLFEHERGLFFIEEPEINMHPGMQRKFIEAILQQKQHQYFITTHSNHFLDLTLDYENISIFSFMKDNVHQGEPRFIVNQVSSGDEGTLRLLGAQNSSVFLSNCTIWVEGITDRLYIRKFLELYINNESKEKIYEDIDYSFVEYGGNNITHWSFLDDGGGSTINAERLCGKLMLIADDDGNKKIQRKKKLKRALKSRYISLSCREIENILSLDTVKGIVKEYEGSGVEFSGCTVIPCDMYLGKFIDEKLFKKGYVPKRRGGYKENSGTIKNKMDFCKKAIENLTYAEMSNEAKALAKKVYAFIKKNKHT